MRLKVIKLLLLVAALFAFIFSVGLVRAEWYAPQEWGLTGFGNVDVDINDGDILMAGVDLHLAKPVWENQNLRLDFRLEGSVANIWQYTRGVELALTPGLRLYLNRGGWLPYVEAGIGPSYNTMNIEEQGIGFNFLSFGGLGIRFPVLENGFIDAGARLRHISNAGLDENNHGVTSIQAQVGFAYEF